MKLQIVQCPACDGRGVTVQPRKRKRSTDRGWPVDPPCELCYGNGRMPLEPCLCGRPRRLDTIGFVARGVFCCGFKDCRDQLDQTKLGYVSVVYTTIAIGRYSMADSQAWAEWCNGQGEL